MRDVTLRSSVSYHQEHAVTDHLV